MKTKTVVAGMMIMIILASCTAAHKAQNPDRWIYDKETKHWYRIDPN